MPYWVTLFSQSCRLISFLILLPVFLVGVLDFAGYAVFRTLGLHRRRVRIQRQTKQDVKLPIGRSGSRRKPRVYHNDRHRPTDRSNIPSIVKAPLLSPGTYDAEILLRQRARSLSSASAQEEAAWVASGGQNARLSSLTNDGGGDLSLTSPDTDGGSQSDADASSRDYFGRAPRVGVDGALGLTDTDLDESGNESGRDSPVHRFSQLKSAGAAGGASRRRGLSGGLNFTPVSPDKFTSAQHTAENASEDNKNSTPTLPQTRNVDISYSASVVSLSSDSLTSSSNGGDRLQTEPSGQINNGKHDDMSSSNLSSSWIGVDQEVTSAGNDKVTTISPPVTVDGMNAAAAAGLETHSHVWTG
ncbi:uncharacterized protein MEPE_03974 [Melanopsichium pennsylvanicum]|uniref:Uncharacterized protein n=2 Tax=Melanopsichium pennsylvanicum TaxID=63383 RepID=A0AAJ4XMF3_9BASI|nr:uncharacterized protein MEPE_03974 [Melanopsichium pennsylvanicum]